MAQVEFRCDRCGKLLKVDSSAGDVVTCTHCQAKVAVPRVPPRPQPQVMGGVRPQPMPVAAPIAAPAGPDMAEEEFQTSGSALAAMSVLMPWAISIVFHVGLLLIMMFFTFLAVSNKTDDEGLIIPSSQWSDDPGVKKPTKSRENDAEKSKAKSDLNKPAPDVVDKVAGQTNPNITIAVPTGSDSQAGNAALGDLFRSGGGKGASFFGSKPGGNVTKIVYVVDKSGSMATQFPYVRAELVRSVGQLIPRQSYTVIFFADGKPDELTVNGRSELHNATDANKAETRKWAEERIPQSFKGSTDPRQALERAFRVPGGPPQLIYLLTDGMFPNETLDTLRRLNPGKKVHINTIMFKDRPPEAEKLLQQIASESGGVYKFISEEALGTEY